MTELLWWHRAGTKVVCIDDSPSVICAVSLRKDAVYTIGRAFIDMSDYGVEEVGLELVERPASGYRAVRFRPARDTSIESLRALLNPPPAFVREVFKEMIAEAEHG